METSYQEINVKKWFISAILLEHLAEAKKKKPKNKQTLWRNTPLPRVAKISTENLTRDELTFQNYKTYKKTMQQEQQTNDRIRLYKKF